MRTNTFNGTSAQLIAPRIYRFQNILDVVLPTSSFAGSEVNSLESARGDERTSKEQASQSEASTPRASVTGLAWCYLWLTLLYGNIIDGVSSVWQA